MNYEDVLGRVLDLGEERHDRTGTGTLSVFGVRMEYSLWENHVPLVTTKKVAWKKALAELLWMVRGETNIRGLGEAKNIWEPWADDRGELGPVYGKQWRDFEGVDQLRDVVETLRRDPWSRRAVMSGWNPKDLPVMALPPCPVLWQFSVRSDGTLALEVYQRSADLFLGVPFDLFEFAALQILVARELGLEAGKLGVTLGDAHIYLNHIAQVRQQLERRPRAYPQLVVGLDAPALLPVPHARRLRVDDFSLVGYEPHGRLMGDVSV